MRSGTQAQHPRSSGFDGTLKKPLAARGFFRRSVKLAAPIAAALAAVACGCVERTIEVRTAPPGARVYLDGRFVGQSPLSIPYTHYGIREVSAETGRAGVAREKVVLNPPFFQVFPLDFVTDCLVPFTLPNSKGVMLTLPHGDGSEKAGRDKSDLMISATELRSRAMK